MERHIPLIWSTKKHQWQVLRKKMMIKWNNKINTVLEAGFIDVDGKQVKNSNVSGRTL